MNLAIYELESNAHKAIAIIGLGFIGSCIADYLALFCKNDKLQQYSIDWLKPNNLASKIQSVCKSQKYQSLDIIWSAGKGGFASGDDQMMQEFGFFKDCMLAIKQTPHLSVVVNLLSSAGGLYEGSGRVHSIEQTSLLRPYSIWKYKQETLLDKLGVQARIYRISSVYGPSGNDQRRGLINTMISHARSGDVVTISANQNTLRDYVFNRDLARHIVESVLQDAPPGIQILASGRPVSINMLKNMLTRMVHKDVLVTYQSNSQNDKNITFDRSLVGFSFAPTSLEEGLPLTVQQN
jgi:hypothetical protein